MSLGPGVTSSEQSRRTTDRFIQLHGNYFEDSGFSLSHAWTLRPQIHRTIYLLVQSAASVACVVVTGCSVEAKLPLSK